MIRKDEEHVRRRKRRIRKYLIRKDDEHVRRRKRRVRKYLIRKDEEHVRRRKRRNDERGGVDSAPYLDKLSTENGQMG